MGQGQACVHVLCTTPSVCSPGREEPKRAAPSPGQLSSLQEGRGHNPPKRQASRGNGWEFLGL